MSARATLAYTAAGVAVLVAAALWFAAGHRNGEAALGGYTRIGTLGSADVFAKMAPDQGKLDVVVRDPREGDLCNGQGPLGGAHPPAICNGSVGQTYVFVAQVPKHSAPAQLCDTATGNAAASQVLVSPAGWTVDLVGVIGPSESMVGFCR